MTDLKINYLAVLIAAVVMFILGAVWYLAFQDTWMALTGVTEAKVSAAGAGADTYIISFVTYLLGAYALAVLFKSMNISTVQTGALTGLLIGALIVGGNIFTNNAYEMKPIRLSVLNAGFSAVGFAAMGAVLGGWTKK